MTGEECKLTEITAGAEVAENALGGDGRARGDSIDVGVGLCRDGGSLENDVKFVCELSLANDFLPGLETESFRLLENFRNASMNM